MVVASPPTHLTWVQSSTFPAVLECARFVRGFVMHRASPLVARRASATRSHVGVDHLRELLKQKQSPQDRRATVNCSGPVQISCFSIFHHLTSGYSCDWRTIEVKSWVEYCTVGFADSVPRPPALAKNGHSRHLSISALVPDTSPGKTSVDLSRSLNVGLFDTECILR